jgi:hypothetical protein
MGNRHFSQRTKPFDEGNPATAGSASAFLPLPLALHVGKRGVSTLTQGQLDAFHEKIMDFAPFIEGDLAAAVPAAVIEFVPRIPR